MSNWYLYCVACGDQPGNELSLICPQCGGELVAGYRSMGRSISRIEKTSTSPTPTSSPAAGSGLDRWAHLLPLTNPHLSVTLGEGNTPLIHAPRLGRELGLDRLYLKLESCNPTGSFKDRQIAVGVSRARELGLSGCVIASSGNAGAALAAYTAHADMECMVFVDKTCPQPKVDQIRMYGAQVLYVQGLAGSVDKYVETYVGLRDPALAKGWWPMVTARCVNPFVAEGSKTMAFEIVETLDRQAPDAVFTPVGGGGLCAGLWKGFSEANHLGATSLPGIYGVQVGGHGVPINHIAAPANRWRPPADTTADYLPLDGFAARQAVEESGGGAMLVEPADIRTAQDLLAKQAGVFAEPQGAQSVAGLVQALRTGQVDKGSRVVCIITGVGFKDDSARQALTDAGPEPREVDSIGAAL